MVSSGFDLVESVPKFVNRHREAAAVTSTAGVNDALRTLQRERALWKLKRILNVLGNPVYERVVGVETEFQDEAAG
jgi:hypothetical protein